MYKILGLDLGTNSIGWSIINYQAEKQEGSILAAGVRIFQEGVDNLGDGEREMSRNASRNQNRSIRRQYFRKKLRKRQLIKLLRENEMCPQDEGDFTIWFRLNPYALRAQAVKEKISRLELGRICYHFTQRRGFQSNSRSIDITESKKLFEGAEGKIGIKETQDRLNGSTLGSYLYSIFPREKQEFKDAIPRIRNRYTTRKMYIDEFECIWQVQAGYHPELTYELKMKLGGRKKDGHITDGVLFYQRRLRSQKHLVGNCTFEPTKGRCPISHPQNEIRRIWEWVNTVECNGEGLSNQEKDTVIGWLQAKEKVEFKLIRKLLKKEGAGFKFNYQDDDRIVGCITISKLCSKNAFGNNWFSFSEKQQNDIWHALYFFEDRDKLQQCAGDKWKLIEKNAEYVSNIFLKQGYASLSIKAIRNILPFLQMGYTYDIAVVLGGIRNAFGDNWLQLSGQQQQFIFDNVPEMIRSNLRGGFIEHLKKMLQEQFGLSDRQLKKLYHHSATIQQKQLLSRLPTGAAGDKTLQLIRNPVVAGALFELRKLVNELLDKYERFDEIKLEMARDLKATKMQRQQIRFEQKRLEAEYDRIKEELNKLGQRHTHENILKYRLWEECQRTCPYTGRQISSSQLFSFENDVQIEHIIPYSRSLDDSYLNKTLCFTDENGRKKERTPYEYYCLEMGETKWEEVKDRVLKLFYDTKDFPKRYQKFKRFVTKDVAELNDFIQRQLNDTRYISREARSYLEQICSTIIVSPGAATAALRHHWGLNTLLNLAADEKTRDDHRHHAVDALTLAATTRSHLQKLANWNRYEKKRWDAVDKIGLPWASFRLDIKTAVDNIFVSYNNKQRVLVNRTYQVEKQGRVFKNKGVAARGALHKESIYGKPRCYGAEDTTYHIKKPLENIRESQQVEKIVDPVVKRLIYDRLAKLGVDVTAKKYKVPAGAFFDSEGRPQIYLPNKRGEKVPVRKVRINEEINNAVLLKPSLGINQYVNPRNNYALIVYEKKDGSLERQVISFWKAVERRREKRKIIELPEDGKQIIAVFKENDMYLLGLDTSAIPQSRLQDHLYKIQKIAGGSYFFEICFRKHTDARKDQEAKGDYKYIKNFGDGTTGWKTHRPIKVHLTATGEITF